MQNNKLRVGEHMSSAETQLYTIFKGQSHNLQQA